MTTPASAEPTEVEAMRTWIADHAPVWVEQVGEQPEAAVVSLSDAAVVAAQYVAIALASQRAEIVARYEKVAEGLDGLYQVHHDNWRANGSTYAEGVSAGLGLTSDRIREAAPK